MHSACVKTSILDLSFASQNCNSLNISTNCPKQLKKIAAIMTLQASIIFLSDLRLNTAKNKVENMFAPSYELHYNSPNNKRGVGMLIKKVWITVCYRNITMLTVTHWA
jgi:hypothetical protein